MTDAAEISADIGLIGGTGLYDLFDEPDWVGEIATPYGDPSGPLTVASVGGRRVAFLARHGAEHRLTPSSINYRANLWALAAIGVRQVVAPCAVGGLSAGVKPGDFVAPTQLVDRTVNRAATYVDAGAVHAPFADPYCARILDVLDRQEQVTVGGTMVVIEGPRFSTRAESQSYIREGWTLINMTGQPEAVLARELGICYASLALVTDMDAGAETGSGVSQEEVFARFAENVEVLRGLLLGLVGDLPDPSGCACAGWADQISRTYLP